MSHWQILSRSILLPGLLALGTLALALVLSSEPQESAARSSETFPPRTFPGAGLEVESPRADAETASPTLAACGPVHAHQASRQDGPPRPVEGRHSLFGTVRAEQGDLLNGRLPSGLHRADVRWLAFPTPSLQVLFCTWLA
jgi:hypothetical protein